MARVAAVVFACVVGLALLFLEGDWLPVSGSAGSGEAVSVAGPEARQWLKTNESESALASNRFGTTGDALRFVNGLYRAGAARVVIAEDAISDDGVERYADALVVTLPADPQKRARVQGLCEQELRREGFELEENSEGDWVYLWWD